MACRTCGQSSTTIKYRLVLDDGTVHPDSPFDTRTEADAARRAKADAARSSSGGGGKIRPIRVSS